MDLEPLLAASPAIKLHVATILPAAALGAVQLARPKGTSSHRALGYLFIALMLGTAINAYFIRTPSGGFSWLHLFIPVTIVELALGFWFVKRGNIAGHRVMMIIVYIGPIVIAGLLTFLPGRIMYRIFFGG
jgi:uncharacterized membrane protein